uniref:CHK kinase-like domain-containing protein n=1 Tax=Bracon brevicornis TaxID=1563983 RepID=A0A6V7J7K7_9HYME
MLETIEVISLQDAKCIAKVALGPDVSIRQFTLKRYSEDKIGFMGHHCRLKICVNREDNGADGEDELVCFVKTLPFGSSTQMEFAQELTAFNKEIAFFSEIFPQLMKSQTGIAWAPKCFLTKDNALCFEDLAVKGFRMREGPFDEVHVKSALRALAGLHASSIRIEAEFGKPLNQIYPNDLEETIFSKKNKIHKWFNSGKTASIFLAERMGLNVSRLSDAFERIYGAAAPSSVKTNVLSHGDLWSNNLLFDDRAKCVLVDFQACRYCPASLDIIELLYLCAAPDLRIAKENEFLQYYYQCLLDDLENLSTKAPPFEEIQGGYAERKIAGCAIAALYFPTALLDGATCRDMLDTSGTFEEFFFGDRTAAMVENMERDRSYKNRIEAAVRELVEMSLLLDDLPVPC